MSEKDEPTYWEDLVKEPFMRLPNGMIDCTLVHPVHGEIPFTASADDEMEYGRMIHAYLTKVMSEGEDNG